MTSLSFLALSFKNGSGREPAKQRRHSIRFFERFERERIRSEVHHAIPSESVSYVFLVQVRSALCGYQGLSP